MSDWFDMNVSTNGLLTTLTFVVFLVGYAIAKGIDRILNELKVIRALLAEAEYRAKKRDEGPDPYEDM